MDRPGTQICLIAAGGEEFTALISSLTEQSDFFKAMFNSGMKEANETRINLPSVSATSLELAVNFIANGEFLESIDLESTAKMLDVAVYLQMPKLISKCSAQLIRCITIESWASVNEVSDIYMLPVVKDAVLAYIASNVDAVSLTDEFYDLSRENVIEILSCELDVLSERVVFKAALRWLKRKELLCDLKIVSSVLNCVRFFLMQSDSELNQCDKDLEDSGLDSTYGVFADIKTAKECLANPRMILEMKSHLKDNFLPRKMSSCVLALGGFTKSNSATNRIMLASVDNLLDQEQAMLDWRFHARSKASPSLPQPLCEHCVVVVGVFVFVAGGQTQYCQDGRHTQKSVYCLDTRTFKWTKLSSMHIKRSLFYMGALGNHLYAVGGWVGPDTVSRSVERYDIIKDCWCHVAQLEIGLHEHAGAPHNGQLYISGGYKGPYRGHLDRVWTYIPQADKWAELSAMLNARSYHCMVSTGDGLLVAGGVQFIGELDAFQDVKSCELYSPSTDQWTVISQIPRCANCMTYFIHEQSIYIFGGHSFETDSDHKYLQIFDLYTNNWSEKLMVNTSNNFYAIALTKINSTIAETFH